MGDKISAIGIRPGERRPDPSVMPGGDLDAFLAEAGAIDSPPRQGGGGRRQQGMNIVRRV